MRWRQDKVTGKLIPIDQAARAQGRSPHILGDIESFVSPVDGTVITDRAQLREHNKRNNVVNAGEFSQEFYDRKAKERARLYTGEQTTAEKQQRGEEINNIIDHLERA